MGGGRWQQRKEPEFLQVYRFSAEVPSKEAEQRAPRKKNGMENLSCSVNWQKTSTFSSGLPEHILQTTSVTGRRRALGGGNVS